MLKEHKDQNVLTHKTKWKDYLLFIQNDSRLLDMLGQPGSIPRELFMDEHDSV